MDVAAIALALGFAFVLGVSDAPNASAALVGSRAAGYRTAIAFSFVFHALGAFLGGTAVALTIAGLIDVAQADVPAAFASACLASIALVATGARLGLPVSASYGLVGGLVGAGLVAGGVHAVDWGSVDGGRPRGLLAILLGLAISPLAGMGLGWLLHRLIAGALRRATRRMVGPLRGGVWLGAAAVALSDGTNDGQKAMGVVAATLVASGSLAELSIPTWTRAAAGVVLALGTAIGGRRIVMTVGRGLYRVSTLHGFGAQSAAAGVVFGCSALGLPISTSTVVASSVVGGGVGSRPRHVRWATFGETVNAWLLTLPVCAALGAVLFLLLREVA